MPRRNDIQCVLIIGSGPIVIGQACEFDYSGTQACKALREEGISVVLLNSNPATIMTDPEFSERTYIEPVTADSIEKILRKEKLRGAAIDSVLPTLGGQTGLNVAMDCHRLGIFERYGVRMLAASPAAIEKAEGRASFRDAMVRIGLDVPRSRVVKTWGEAQQAIEAVKLPCCIRPAYTLGGTGGGFATTPEEYEQVCKRGIEYSPVSEVLIEESLWGWKEFELEVMRDRADNVVIICSIENFDPMGVHTGDSITVAPAQTLTDKEYQRMRDASIAIMREIGVDTGGSNIQFAVHPQTGRMCVIEMNPRVSRSSALASKATGFPIAKIATKLAIGYTLDELSNDITRTTPACFEPAIDYVVVKIPRWTFEKFPEADETLTTQMKSVGEAMSIGRTFKESLQKCVRSMEIKRFGLGLDKPDRWLREQRRRQAAAVESRAAGAADDGVVVGSRAGEAPPDEQEQRATRWPIPDEVLIDKLCRPAQGRLFYVRYAFKQGWSVQRVHDLSCIDPWFLENVRQLTTFDDELIGAGPEALKLFSAQLAARAEPWKPASGEADEAAATRRSSLEKLLRRAKQWGYSDVQLAHTWGVDASVVRAARCAMGIEPVYKLVDTCAAEFEAATPYFYSTHESPPYRLAGDGSAGAPAGSLVEDEVRISDRRKVVVLGGGPNRIGQGIEFDYCCVHAAMAARELGFEAVMINSNPETVSTDYDTSDLLFFEPLTHEDVLNVCERLNGRPLDPTGVSNGLLHGVICQFGGQTPLNLAMSLKKSGVPIIGTSPESIHLAEDRESFAQVLNELELRQPPNGIARTIDDARAVAERLGYPVLVRPSFVLGGRAMEICNNEAELRHYMAHAAEASGEHPVLIDSFLSDATEVDVDAVSDGQRTVVSGVMEHIEQAGIHSGDSAMSLPAHSLSAATVAQIKYASERLAKRLGVIGLMNVQYAIKEEDIYVLEVNPRASRTVPFVAKATGMAWARIAAKVMLGKTLDELAITEPPPRRHIAVKQSVFPFNKFPGVDVALGPEMRSTGEVMGVDERFSMAYAKGFMAASISLPKSGKVFLSVNSRDRAHVAPIAHDLARNGFELVATEGTARVIRGAGLKVTPVHKIREGSPNPLDLIEAGELALVINTPGRTGRQTDEGRIRAAAALHRIPIITTLTGARAAVLAIASLRRRTWDVFALQDL